MRSLHNDGSRDVTAVSRSLAVNLYHLIPVGRTTEFARFQARFQPETLKSHLETLACMLDARVVSLSGALFEPYGASAAMLFGQQDSALAHLDKSHIAVHTYFESDERAPWGIFRAEMEASTCGEMSVKPLLQANLDFFGFDFLTLDYRVRGLARDAAGDLCIPRGSTADDVADKHLVQVLNRPMGQDRFGIYFRPDLEPERESEVRRLVDQIQ